MSSPIDREQETAEIASTSATQSRTYEDNEDCCRADNAIDKDLSTGALTYDDGGAGWLKIELGKSYFIHKTVIYWMFFTNWYYSDHWCTQSEANFRACVDKHNNVLDVSVYQEEVHQKSCGILQLTYGLEQSDQIYTLLCMSQGDTVKLSKSEGHIIVFELAVTTTCKKILIISYLARHIYEALIFLKSATHPNAVEPSLGYEDRQKWRQPNLSHSGPGNILSTAYVSLS